MVVEGKAPLRAHTTLALNTLAFTVCFAGWMLNGVLVTFLSGHQVFEWSSVEIGWLLGIPVLAGSLGRLPAGLLTDRFGGKPVFIALLTFCAVPMFLLSYARTFWEFALCSFGFGLLGVGFAVGIAFTSVWYPKRNQGTALGVLGAGNAGAGLTTLFAPTLLNRLTDDGQALEGWRTLPRLYAAVFVAMALVFLVFSKNRRPAVMRKGLLEQLRPLRVLRVWRFGLYYFLVFGCFVAFSQWLVPYFVNVYYMPLVTAGILASVFSVPSGVIRALGGWMSDRWGARRVMTWVLGLSCLLSAAVTVPKMEIFSPGVGVMATRAGTVTAVSAREVTVGEVKYPIAEKPSTFDDVQPNLLVFPTKDAWQEPVVVVGESVPKRGLVAAGVTRIFFQANVWIFAALVMVLGVVWGIGKAGVYKYIPDYFPEEVGVVGGLVGVIGGLGGFVCPILFGYLLELTGLWTSCWMFMFALSVVCIAWLARTVRLLDAKAAPRTSQQLEERR